MNSVQGRPIVMNSLRPSSERRRDTIQTQSERIIELETRRDPKRSSSKLSERGTTHPEDLKR